MQPQTSDQLRAWFKHVEPICAELFNAAYAMCGNYALAEYALRSAILEVWLQNASAGMGFRERLRSALRRAAFEAAQSEDAETAEFTWPGFPPAGPDAGPVRAQLAAERLETQRLAVLRWGCGLSVRTAALLTGQSRGRARGELGRLEARCRRALSGQDRARAETLITREARKLLARRGPDTPSPSQVYRAFEAEADGAMRTGHGVSRVVGRICVGLMALLCAGAFWLFAVLVQPM